ncbi:MAG: CocE/NonD family hydrolase [Thermoleophilaceae bacterium]|nr:CocE/NonD family hydrolase [Thermoleophilaceae bacterium]
MALEFEHVAPAPVSPLATEHMVRMRDGVRLATDVYLPDGVETTEAVLVRLPYDKCGDYCFMPRIAPLFLEHGYAFVVQDVRGKFRSEGDEIPFVNEVLDGYDTLDWIVAQPWSNGRVGMFGDSYYGFTQWAAVASGHPALKAICPRVTGADVVDLPMPGSDEVGLLLMASYYAEHWVGSDAYDFEIDWTPRPLLDVFEPIWEALGGRSHGFDLSYPHPIPMRRFPTGHPFDARPVPTLQIMGWFDNIAPWQWRDHERIAKRPGWAQAEHLYIDAVDHEIYHLADTPITEETDHDVNPAALEALLARYVDPTLEFFEVFLRERRPASTIPKVRWRPAHGDWKSADSWPPPGTEERTLYLGSGGTLAPEPPAEAEEAVWTHDPDDLVPSRVSNPFAFLLEYPDESGYEERSDVLAFSAEPVASAVELAGPLAFEATVRSSGPVMDLFVRLLDVDPDGAARYVARGELHVEPAGADTPVRISLQHAGYLLRPGHALRLHLAGSDFPEFVPNPGTGANPWLARETRTNEHVVRLGGQAPARLTFTVLP